MSVFCCEMMRSNVEQRCDQHADRFDCPDCLIHVHDKSGTYGIIVHDGGSSVIAIAFCPWCGTRVSNEDFCETLQ